MSTHAVDDLESEGSRFYIAAVAALNEAQIPFLVGGAYALEAHTGIARRTKDFDLFVLPQNVDAVLEVFRKRGYLTKVPFPHWLGKAFCGDDFIDVIYNSGNGICHVDEEWFEHAISGKVLGMDLKLCPAEETIWQKAFILERDRCDVADVAHYLRRCAPRLDWQRLVRRFGERWRVLLAQIVLFEFIYPGHRDEIPAWLRDELAERFKSEPPPVTDPHDCHGTLLSATQYLRDIDYEGYHDGRQKPLGDMSREDIAIWTANFMKPK
jgi:hypothetical protein